MNTKDGKKYMGIMLAGVMVCAVFAAAMPAMVSAAPMGATADPGQTQTKTPVTGGTNVSKGGYITELNFSTTQVTAKWQGYYGNVTGLIALMASDGTKMYEWPWTESNGGEVIATTNDSIPPWASLAATGDSDMGTINTKWQWESTQSDDAARTFPDTTMSVTIAGTTISNTRGTDDDLKVGSGGSEGDYKEVVLKDESSPDAKEDFIFVGIINNDKTAFDNTKKDYEMLVPVEDTPGSTEPYYFYVELT